MCDREVTMSLLDHQCPVPPPFYGAYVQALCAAIHSAICNVRVLPCHALRGCGSICGCDRSMHLLWSIYSDVPEILAHDVRAGSAAACPLSPVDTPMQPLHHSRAPMLTWPTAGEL